MLAAAAVRPVDEHYAGSGIVLIIIQAEGLAGCHSTVVGLGGIVVVVSDYYLLFVPYSLLVFFSIFCL